VPSRRAVVTATDKRQEKNGSTDFAADFAPARRLTDCRLRLVGATPFTADVPELRH
jgi:hypothetical protein